MYSSYTAASFPRIYELADQSGINLRGIVTWAFEFENQPWFNGYRSLATNGIDKPVLNIFRMFGMMQGERVQVTGDFNYDFKEVRDSSVRGEKPDIGAMASASDSLICVMVWNYHDLNVPFPSSPVQIDIQGIRAHQVMVAQYRVGHHHSNAHETWKSMGSPQHPSEIQYRVLEDAGQLQLFAPPEPCLIRDGSITVTIELSGQEVSLITIRKINDPTIIQP